MLADPESGHPRLPADFEPGDYCGPILGYTGDLPAVFFCFPVADDHPDFGVRHVCSPPHTFVENDDGTLTVQPSILAVRPGGDGWHGYLEAGAWREC